MRCHRYTTHLFRWERVTAWRFINHVEETENQKLYIGGKEKVRRGKGSMEVKAVVNGGGKEAESGIYRHASPQALYIPFSIRKI